MVSTGDGFWNVGPSLQDARDTRQHGAYHQRRWATASTRRTSARPTGSPLD